MPDTHMVWNGPALSDPQKPCVFCKEQIVIGQQFGILGCDFPDRRHYVCHICCMDKEVEQQMQDKSRIWLIWGESKSLNAWLRDPRSAITTREVFNSRITRDGMSPEEALSTPYQKRNTGDNPVTILGGVCSMLLSDGVYVTFDEADYGLVKDYHWIAHRNGHTNYASGTGKILMHRLLLGITDPTILIDHKDRNGLNNCRNNLRLATRAQNSINSKKPMGITSSKYKGVTWAKGSKKWAAQLNVAGKHMHLGLFDSEEEAHLAYQEGVKQHFGEFCPEDWK